MEDDALKYNSHTQHNFVLLFCSFLFPLLKPLQGTIWFGRQRKQQMKFWPKLYSWPLTSTGLAGVIDRMQITPLLNKNHMWHFSMIFNIDVLQKFKCAKLPSFSLAFCVSSRKIILPDDLSWYLSGDQCDSTALLLVLISSSLADKTDNSYRYTIATTSKVVINIQQ